MQKKQWILLGVGVLLVVLLLQFGQFKSKKASVSGGTPASNMPMPGGNADQHAHDFDINAYLEKQLALLSDTARKRAKTLTELAESTPNPVNYKNIAECWEIHDELNAAAYYYKKGAFLENTEKSLTFAGQLLLVLMQRNQDPGIRAWQAQEAIDCFNKVLERNPESTETKIALATCYTEGTGETMKGVTLLREVTAKDSTNIAANIILGKLAIQSGQFDKAQRRLEMVVSMQPDNTEAMYFLAEAYRGLGQKEKAVKWFEQCKKLVNNPDFSAEIDRYIQSMK